MNEIHELACVHPDARLGQGNYVGPFVAIGPHVVIGDNNHFEAHCCIGTAPQHRSAKARGGVAIGNANVFREYATVHDSTNAHLPTKVGNRGYFMANAHIAHDCIVEDDVTMANNATLGGHTYIMRAANLGFGAIVHQGQVIGAWSMLGMGCIVPKRADILPGEIYAGNPARHVAPNTVGLERHGVTAAARKVEIERFMTLRRGWSSR